jgi:IMP dehydrogenase
MSDILIGGAKRARRAYSFDEIAIAPSRRTRDQAEVSTAWNIDAYRFDLPFIAAPMDSVVSPASAQVLAAQGALPTLNAEGLWARYEDPTALLAGVAVCAGGRVARREPGLARAQALHARQARTRGARTAAV